MRRGEGPPISPAELQKMLKQAQAARQMQPQLPMASLVNKNLTDFILVLDQNCVLLDRFAGTKHWPKIEPMRARFQAAREEALDMKARALIRIGDDLIADVDRSLMAMREDFKTAFEDKATDEPKKDVEVVDKESGIVIVKKDGAP